MTKVNLHFDEPKKNEIVPLCRIAEQCCWFIRRDVPEAAYISGGVLGERLKAVIFSQHIGAGAIQMHRNLDSIGGDWRKALIGEIKVTLEA